MPFDCSDAAEKDRRLVHGLADMRPATERLEKHILECIDHRFAEESDGAAQWAPLAESTLAQKEAAGYGGAKILERTGDLRNSMKGSHDVDSAEAGPSEDIAYAGVHADGSKDGHTPQRDYLALSEEEMEQADRILADYLSTIE